jgi:hypothetical protein
MTNNRRGDPRILHYFDCRWYGKWGVTDARLDDLSVSGCHIVNRFTTPDVGEVIEIEVISTSREPLLLAGEVVQVERGAGFAVRFAEIDDNTREGIQTLLTEAEASNRRVGGS